MCKLCDEGRPQNHSRSQLGRRDFLKLSAAGAAGTAGMSLFSAPAQAAHDDDGPPADTGRKGRRYVIRGGHVMTMDPSLGTQGNFVQADVLVEGKHIVDVRPNIRAAGAAAIDARGKIVMPGFIDTHHHLFETAIRSYLSNGILVREDPNVPDVNYFEHILLTFAPAYLPDDVYISELFGALSALDAGVTTVHDISQIHHSPAHSDEAIRALFDAGSRAVFGFFESAGAAFIGTHPENQYPLDADRIKLQWFPSDDQLVTMIMGGEIYLPGYEEAWKIGRRLGIPVAAHIVGTFGMRGEFDAIANGERDVGKGPGQTEVGFGPDNLFIHMTGMSNTAWEKVRDAGAHVSLAVPIEMNMRHGTPPIATALSLGIQPSLSTDVEVTLTADMFTQMRSTMNLQRMFVNAAALGEGYPAQLPNHELHKSLPLLKTQDVLRYATMEGARDLRLDRKVGSLTPGKEADLIVLDAEAINVAPLNNVPGAVVSLMERSNVETVIVAGKVRKWKGRLLGVDLPRLRAKLEASRDGLFTRTGISQDLFRTT